MSVLNQHSPPLSATSAEPDNVRSVLSEVALLTTEEVARIAGVTPDVAKRWRRMGKGPAYVKLGKRVAYRRADVVAWINGSVVRHEPQMEDAA